MNQNRNFFTTFLRLVLSGVGWSYIRKIQMHSIIQEIYSLTLELQEDNRNLLKLIEHYSSTPCRTDKKEPWSSTSLEHEHTQLSSPKLGSPKIAEATSVSRVSKSTIKQSSQRCKSAQSLKLSRKTQKQKGTVYRGSSTKKEGREESVLSRLKKVGQSRKGKVGPSLLVKKKSKIYHFQTHY